MDRDRGVRLPARLHRASFGGGHGIALANGSLALELALRAFGIGPGDEVVVTPRTFVASAFCVVLVGATPVFADVDRDSGNITAETIAAVLTERTRAVIPVHLGGWPADMAAIMALAAARGLKVIEDCAQAHGAEIGGRPVGSFGDAAAFSFCQDKIISTGGEGGFTSFQDDDAWEWAWSFKDHGKNRARAMEPAGPPGFRWLHDSVGTNWRMTGPQAAIGLAPARQARSMAGARARNAAIWTRRWRGRGPSHADARRAVSRGAYYKLYAYVERRRRRERRRDEILERAAAAGSAPFPAPAPKSICEAAFEDLRRRPLPVREALGRRSLMVEVHPTLDSRRLRDRADAVAEIVAEVLDEG